MIEKILELMERAVVAMERMADAKDRVANELSSRVAADVAEQSAPSPAAETQEPESEPEPPAEDSELDRDQLKARLTELGVEFSDRARTPTLVSLLAAAEREAESAPEPEPPAPTEEFTRDQVLEALKAYAAEHGNDAVKAILAEHGKSATVTDMDKANYAAVIAACKEG